MTEYIIIITVLKTKQAHEKEESKTGLKFWIFFIVLFQNKDHTLFRDNLQLELQKIVAQAESTHSICYLYTLWLQVCLHKENHRKYTQGCLNIHRRVFQIKNQWPVCYNHLQVDKRMANLYTPLTLTRGSRTRQTHTQTRLLLPAPERGRDYKRS